MANYYLVHQGRKNKHAKEAYEGKWVGIGFLPDVDLTQKLPEN